MRVLRYILSTNGHFSVCLCLLFNKIFIISITSTKSVTFNCSSDASIRASAQSDASKTCSGGSGGLIRLKGQKVIPKKVCGLV